MPDADSNFLTHLMPGTEVPLLITAEPASDAVRNTLAQSGLTELRSIDELMPNGSFFSVLTEENAQPWYEFAAEYPSRDMRIMTREQVTPVLDTRELLVLLVASRDFLAKREEAGMSFLSVCGMTHQTT